jgi:hypothetical protein
MIRHGGSKWSEAALLFSVLKHKGHKEHKRREEILTAEGTEIAERKN